MEVNWFDQLIMLGALQGFILAVVIWKKKNTNKTATSLLSALVVLTSLILIGRVFYLTDFLKKFWVIYTYTDIIIFLFGPIIYFFTITLLGKSLPPWAKLRWHLLPAMIHLLVFNTILSLLFTKVITSFTIFQIRLLYYSLEFFAIVSLGIYTLKSIQLFRQYESEYYDSFSMPALSTFLKPFLYFFSFLSMVWGLAFVLKFVDIIPGDEGYVYYGLWTLIAISTYLMSYKILLNPDVLNMQKVEDFDKTNLKPAPNQSIEILASKKQLEQCLNTTKIYTNPKLSLEDLAQTMQISRHELSRIINQGFGKNFFDLINSYRVKEFIKIYKEGENLTFLEVAYQVGFNSKSAFNRAFKKETGNSPSNFFKNQPTFQKV